MADKEATVFIIDLGKSMGKKNNGREVSDLDWTMQYVWDKITTKVATERKTIGVGVIGLRTNETNNELDTEDAYQNISEIQPIKQVLLSDIRHLRDTLVPSKTNSGDALSAIVIAIQMIGKHCRKLKYKRKIILVTDGTSHLDGDDVPEITSKIKEDGIDLVILGVDFDDAEAGFKEENKSSTKRNNETILQTLADSCDGAYGTMLAAISELGLPEIKETRPVNSYKGQLRLGNPYEFDDAMAIEVERYPKVRLAKAPTASSFVVTSGTAPGPSSTQTSGTLQNGEDERGTENGLSAVKNARTYLVDDPTAPGGKRELAREELEKGYSYGQTAVHISQSEQNITEMETEACLDIVGFVEKEKYEQYLNISVSNIIIANKTEDKSSMALSSFVLALQEREVYAVARFVPKNNKPPVLLLLAPYIEKDYECLIDVELPFAEDLRPYVFPPLDKVVTVGGKKLVQHRNLPNEDLMKAMSDYVDAMDLSNFGEEDEDGNPQEYASMVDAFSPKLHRITQAIKFRAVNPIDEVPGPSQIITKFSKPPIELLEKAQNALDDLIKAGDVKKVPPKQKGRKRARDVDKPLSGLDVDELLGREKRARISADNAIPEFKQLLKTTEDLGEVREAVEQMSSIVQSYIKHSVGDSGYKMSVEAIRIMKEELTELEEPGLYNEMMKELKTKILGNELGTGRGEMFYMIKVNRLGLIDKTVSELSTVSPEDARKYLQVSAA